MGSVKYRPAVDGLRALAVISVFIFHLNHKWLPGGFVGVDIFFVISGYLITTIILKDLQTNSFSFQSFYQRRIARIFPAFFTVALITVAAAKFIYSPQDVASAGANLAAAALSVVNLKLLVQGNYFDISPDAQPFLHYWSLSVEEQFYIVFPLLLVLTFKLAPKYRMIVLGSFFVASFITCVILTELRPVWAFYLLPTRAWELLAGCILATYSARADSVTLRWPSLGSAAGLASIGLSFVLVPEGPNVPGFWALLPVLGVVAILWAPAGANGMVERFLAATPLVLVGRVSYSLYLWHWPVFSMVDYKMYLASASSRLALKIVLSLLAATLSFWLIENPARTFLNRRQSRPLAYVFLAGALALCVPLGISIRSDNYVNAEFNDVAKGGLIFHPCETAGCSVMLMGDSNGSMYGKLLKDICETRSSAFTVLSVAGGDPLPSSEGAGGQLWAASLAIVQKMKPDCLVLACEWSEKLRDDQTLSIAVESLKPYVGHLVLLNQPPRLPENASRASLRLGAASPPFYEDAETRRRRVEVNELLRSFNSGNCIVVDISSHFQSKDGEVLFLDDHGRQLYHDRTHLSGFGADLVRFDLIRAVYIDENNE